jgi:anti-anti-sigma regulatory factor
VSVHPAAGRGGTGFRETIDWPSATISAQGHLTAQAVDLIRGAAEQLRRSGRTRITLDLNAVLDADDAGLDALRAVAADLRSHAGWLVVVLEKEHHW